MKKLLKLGSSEDHKMILITDNAKYHHANLHKEWRDEHAGSFALDFLPPYSPDLNLIERVWKLVRRLCLHNCYFYTLKEIENTVEHRFLEWSHGSETLRKLCAFT